MKILLLMFMCSIWFLNLHAQDSVKTDSVVSRRFIIGGTLSASYIDQHNWEENSKSAISLLSSADMRHRLTRSSGWMHNHYLKTEISYLKYNDSVWIKNSDYLKFSFQWIEKQKPGLNHSYSLFFNTQWLNSTKQELTETGYRNYWCGGFLNPATLDLAYGINKSFLTNSFLNIAFANVRISSKPKISSEKQENENDKSVFITPHSYIKTMYGFSAQLDMMEELYKEVVFLENNSQLFFNAISRSSVHFDFNNRIAIRFIKFLQLRFDTHLIYNPDYSGKIQYRQEVLLGIFFEHRNVK